MFAGVSPRELSSSGAMLLGWAGSMMTAMSPTEPCRWEACMSNQPPVVVRTRTVGAARRLSLIRTTWLNVAPVAATRWLVTVELRRPFPK